MLTPLPKGVWQCSLHQVGVCKSHLSDSQPHGVHDDQRPSKTVNKGCIHNGEQRQTSEVESVSGWDAATLAASRILT